MAGNPERTVRRKAPASRLGVKDVVRLFNVTARALRFYDQQGLLKVSRDRRGFRFYDAAACEQLGWIVLLRGAGVSLADIASVFAIEPGAARCARALAVVHKSQAAAWVERQRIDHALVALESMIGQGASGDLIMAAIRRQHQQQEGAPEALHAQR